MVSWTVDQDDECVHFLEAAIGQHKTMRAAQHRFRFLPVAALGQGVREHDWVSAWLDVRRALGVKPPPEHPPLPAPDKSGNPTLRPVSAAEGTKWLRALFERHAAPTRASTHSAKATLLSWAAKAGLSYEDRLVMGYHSIPGRMALVYSRDGSARALRLLQDLLKQVRAGRFVPEASRSGRFPLEPPVVLIKDEVAEPDQRVPASVREHQSLDHVEGS